MSNNNMLDYYSYMPGPSKESGCDEIFTTMICRDRTMIRNERQMRYHINKLLDYEIVRYGGLGSYTGWNITTRISIINNMRDKVQLIQKSTLMWRKLRVFAMTLGTFIVAKNIRYKFRPDGDYMKEIQEKYKDVFQ